MFRATMCPSSGADDCVVLSPRVGVVQWTHYLLTGSDSLPADTEQHQHVAITLRCRQLLKMSTWLPETCWATCKGEIKDNTKVTSSWFLTHTEYYVTWLCAFVDAGTHHAKRTRHLVICSLPRSAVFSALCHNFRGKKNKNFTEHKMCFGFLYNVCLEHLSLWEKWRLVSM